MVAVARRLVPDVQDAGRPVVPAVLAAGPDVTVWATEGELRRVEAAPLGSARRSEAVQGAMLTARRRHRDACDRWLDEHGLEGVARRAAIPSRRPFWPPKD